jgi:hypothetical protein
LTDRWKYLKAKHQTCSGNLKSPGITYQTKLHVFLKEHPPIPCDYSNRKLAHVSVHIRYVSVHISNQKRTTCVMPEKPRRSFTGQDASLNSTCQSLECFWQWLRDCWASSLGCNGTPVWDSLSCFRDWPEQPKLQGRSSIGPVHGAAEVRPRQALAAGQGARLSMQSPPLRPRPTSGAVSLEIAADQAAPCARIPGHDIHHHACFQHPKAGNRHVKDGAIAPAPPTPMRFVRQDPIVLLCTSFPT